MTTDAQAPNLQASHDRIAPHIPLRLRPRESFHRYRAGQLGRAARRFLPLNVTFPLAVQALNDGTAVG